MATLDHAAVIKALQQEISMESDAIKACLVLIEQLVAEIASLKAQVASYEAAVTDATATVQTDGQSLTAEVAKYSASGQPNV
jgi:uncharacterized protein YlxW (UPF0749 family)